MIHLFHGFYGSAWNIKYTGKAKSVNLPSRQVGLSFNHLQINCTEIQNAIREKGKQAANLKVRIEYLD